MEAKLIENGIERGYVKGDALVFYDKEIDINAILNEGLAVISSEMQDDGDELFIREEPSIEMKLVWLEGNGFTIVKG